MIDRIIRSFEMEYDGKVFKFEQHSLLGIRVVIYWETRVETIEANYLNLDDTKELEAFMKIILNIEKEFQIVPKYRKVIDAETVGKLKDFDDMLRILNRYVGN